MNFGEAISTCFKKYVVFDGRASRSEYWWFALFTWLVNIALRFVIPALAGLFALAVLLPSLAVGARRLHDTNRSAWFLLLWLIPIVGWIILLVFFVQEGKEPNAYSTETAA